MQPTAAPGNREPLRLMPSVGLTTRLPGNPREPVARLASVMREGEQADDAVPFEVGDVIRKTMHGEASRRHVVWQARHRSTATPLVIHGLMA